MRLMSEYRNHVKNYVDMYYSDFDYFGMIDTDTHGPFSINGLAHSFSTQPLLNWDMISSNGKTGPLFTLGILYYYDHISIYHYDKDLYNNILMRNDLMLKLSSVENDPIKVESAFGGFAIYKMSSIKNINKYIIIKKIEILFTKEYKIIKEQNNIQQQCLHKCKQINQINQT